MHWYTNRMGLATAISIRPHKKPAEVKVHPGRNLLGKAAEMLMRHSVLDQNHSGLKHFLGVNWVK